MFTPRKIDSRRALVQGFTLFEMLVAVALFALMTTLAWGGLQRVMATRTAVEQEAARWRDIEALFNRMQADLNQVVVRPVRNEFSVSEKGFRGEQALVGQDAAHLTLVRATPDGPPRRIGYRFVDGRLELLQWPALDLAPRARAQVSVLWTGLHGFKVRYLENSSWIDTWPRDSSDFTGLPRAIEVTVQLDAQTELKRVLLLP